MPSSNKLLLVAALLALIHIVPNGLGAPVPIPKELSNVIEEEEGLLVLVPTVPVDGQGQPTKREIDYELISIPSELIRKTVREITDSYGTRGGPVPSPQIHKGMGGEYNAGSSIFISDLRTDDDDEILVRSSPGTSYSGGNSNSKDPLASLSSSDLGKILSSVTSLGLNAATQGASFAGQAKNVLSTATSAVQGGTKAVRWALKQKASGLRSFAEFAGNGLQYAGRLSSAVLKVLLKIPGIKAKIISDLIQAGQPLATAMSDVISESAVDLGDIFSAQTEIFKDAVNIMFKLVQEVLSLKGRAIASLSAGGLDKGANLVSAGVKVGSALVQTAGDAFSAVGRGVGELVQVASEANIPKPPSFPSIKFPNLPTITFPHASSNSYKPPSNSYESPSPPSQSYTS